MAARRSSAIDLPYMSDQVRLGSGADTRLSRAPCRLSAARQL